MLMKIRNRQKGFTLIELLIVVAIIGIIAALLIPNFLDALQKAKQKRTVADARNVGTAMFSWLTDQVGAAAAGGAATTDVDLGDYNGAITTSSGVAGLLVPLYIQTVPKQDGWKHDFVYNMKDGTRVLEEQVLLVWSGGRNGTNLSGTVTVTAFDPTDYNQDILWVDGFFVRWPQKTTT